jgi:hypothetical protein
LGRASKKNPGNPDKKNKNSRNYDRAVGADCRLEILKSRQNTLKLKKNSILFLSGFPGFLFGFPYYLLGFPGCQEKQIFIFGSLRHPP